MKRILLFMCTIMLMLSVPMTSVAAEWKQDAVGWWYQNDDGSYPASSWQQIDNVWYHFNGSGYIDTGWILDGNSWYYLDTSGAMQTGWFFDGSVWYYLESSGAMRTAPLEENGLTYYFNDSGACVNPNGEQSGIITVTEDEYYYVLANWITILDSMITASDSWDVMLDSGEYETVMTEADDYYATIIELYYVAPPAGYESSHAQFKLANECAVSILYSYYYTADGLQNNSITEDDAYIEYLTRLVLFNDLSAYLDQGIDLLP